MEKEKQQNIPEKPFVAENDNISDAESDTLKQPQKKKKRYELIVGILSLIVAILTLAFGDSWFNGKKSDVYEQIVITTIGDLNKSFDYIGRKEKKDLLELISKINSSFDQLEGVVENLKMQKLRIDFNEYSAELLGIYDLKKEEINPRILEDVYSKMKNIEKELNNEKPKG